jgi:glycosyltransferase involved in cell wall biosynthesis
MSGTFAKVPISAFIITRNERHNIDDCIASLDFVDEIVVVDDFSEDGTSDRCKELGCRVISNKFTGFSAQKKFAMEAAVNGWVLEIDADERISAELKQAISKIHLADFEKFDGFAFRRLTRFWGKWIRHSSMYPDYKVRLYHRERGEWTSSRVHERFKINGMVSRIPCNLLHCQDLDLKSFASRTIRYAELSAEDLYDRGRRSHWYDFLRPVHSVFWRYVVRLGFLDGTQGAAIAAMGGFGTFYKYFRLFELCMERCRTKRILDDRA